MDKKRKEDLYFIAWMVALVSYRLLPRYWHWLTLIPLIYSLNKYFTLRTVRILKEEIKKEIRGKK